MLQTRQNGMPAYRRIQGAILKRIEGGRLKPGDAVSSERELAKIHSVSLMTARHALAGLEKEGVVERKRGSGTFVAPIHFNDVSLMSCPTAPGSTFSVKSGVPWSAMNPRLPRRCTTLMVRPGWLEGSRACGSGLSHLLLKPRISRKGCWLGDAYSFGLCFLR